MITKRKIRIGTPPAGSYSLASGVKSSAAIYDASGVMQRTLWSGIAKAAGNYTLQASQWDGNLDDLTTTSGSGTYSLVEVKNKIQAEWEGVIGNTSDTLTGEHVHKSYLPIYDMCVAGNIGFACTDFAERSGSTFAIDLNNPQKKYILLPEDAQVQQSTNRVCTDGTRLYMGGLESQNNNQSYVAAINISGYTLGTQYGYNATDYLAFQGATVTTFGTSFRACDVVANPGRITGMAVQVTGNYLFVSRKDTNSLHVVHKTSGVLAQSLTYTNVTLLAVDPSDNLWVAYNGKVEKFTVNSSTGALTSAGVNITAVTNVQGLAVNSTAVIVADAGTAHQAKYFNPSTGALANTLGRNESYGADATVYNDKFYFTDQRQAATQFTFVATQGTNVWVGDRMNYRYLKFDANRAYVTHFAYLPHIWSSYTDLNQPGRVFADYLEFTVDYTKPLQVGNANNAWTLAKNWGFNVTPAQDSDHDRLRNVITLSNNRIYALQVNGSNWEVVELAQNNVLRFTSITIPRYEAYEIQRDGSVFGQRWAGGNAIWEKKTLTGFDGTGNPQWGAFTTVATIPDVATDPKPSTIYQRQAGITANNIIPSYKADKTTGYHLGGIAVGGTAFKWKTAKTVSTTSGAYPSDGTYDIGRGSAYAGSVAMSLDDLIVIGMNSEGYDGGQTNIWNIFKDNGLFLTQFGTKTIPGQIAQAEMAGSAFSPSLVKVNGVVYLWHNDESFHGGLHRWKITGLDTIQEHTITITK